MTNLRLRDAANQAARAHGTRVMGPLGDPDRRRSALDALSHGLRGLSLASGADRARVGALLAAVRADLGAVGPCARHLAETAASCLLRAERAERWERGLEATLEAKGTTMPEAMLADPAVRATLALIHRMRRDADADLRRSVEALRRLHAARLAGLFPSGEQAYRVERRLDAAISANEPVNQNTELTQQVDTSRELLADAPPSSPALDGAAVLNAFHAQATEEDALRFWDALPADQRAAANAAAEAERRAG